MRFIRSLYVSPLFYWTLSGLVVAFILAYFFPVLLVIAKLLVGLSIAALVVDLLLLYNKNGLEGHRVVPNKLSNGDHNEVNVYISSSYNLKINLEIIDELPFQFQIRDFNKTRILEPRGKSHLVYTVRPVKRGEYIFGALNLFALSPIGLIKRRYRFDQNVMVPVYPSYLQMRKYELLAISNTLTDYGIKKIRRIGHNLEFEQIKDYVVGDDFRTINWKATARKHSLMVNTYQDERSQQVYSVIDKSRIMQMPFNAMTLLDHAINASLVISNIAIKKDDKAGILTYQHKVGAFLPASRRPGHMSKIQELLFNEKTAFKEADYSRLYATIRKRITQRSLLLFFTNFETLSGLKRQLPYLLRLARSHLLVVIFFENTEVSNLIQDKTQDVQRIYRKAIAEHLMHEKKLIAKELNAHGIHTILTAPEHLSVNTINKYLELKARGLI